MSDEERVSRGTLHSMAVEKLKLEVRIRSLTEENERLKTALSMIADEDGPEEYAVPSGGWPAWAQNLALEALSPIDPPLARPPAKYACSECGHSRMGRSWACVVATDIGLCGCMDGWHNSPVDPPSGQGGTLTTKHPKRVGEDTHSLADEELPITEAEEAELEAELRRDGGA